MRHWGGDWRLDNDDQEDDQDTNLLCCAVTLADTHKYWVSLPILSTDSQGYQFLSILSIV